MLAISDISDEDDDKTRKMFNLIQSACEVTTKFCMIFMERWEKIVRMRTAMRERIKSILGVYALKQKSLEGQLHQLNPTSILARGFAIVRLEDGRIVRSPKDVKKGVQIQIRVAKGSFDAVKK